MSNLLNKSSKKKLLERGPQITPENQFELNEVEPLGREPEIKPLLKKETPSEKKVTSVRVKKSTRDKLNALVSLNKADTIDEIIENMIDEYLSAHITRDEKKQFDMVIDLYKSRR